MITDVIPGFDYSDVVVDHFERPRNVGRFAPAADVIEGSAGRRDQGVVFTLSARIGDSLIKSVRFEVYGCPHCIAAGSWLSERLAGCTQDDLRRWSWQEVALAIEIPPEKRGRLLVLEDAVRALAEAWQRLSSKDNQQSVTDAPGALDLRGVTPQLS